MPIASACCQSWVLNSYFRPPGPKSWEEVKDQILTLIKLGSGLNEDPLSGHQLDLLPPLVLSSLSKGNLDEICKAVEYWQGRVISRLKPTNAARALLQ